VVDTIRLAADGNMFAEVGEQRAVLLTPVQVAELAEYLESLEERS
jgi:hypothetical protein